MLDIIAPQRDRGHRGGKLDDSVFKNLAFQFYPPQCIILIESILFEKYDRA